MSEFIHLFGTVVIMGMTTVLATGAGLVCMSKAKRAVSCDINEGRFMSPGSVLWTFAGMIAPAALIIPMLYALNIL